MGRIFAFVTLAWLTVQVHASNLDAQKAIDRYMEGRASSTSTCDPILREIRRDADQRMIAMERIAQESTGAVDEAIQWEKGQIAQFNDFILQLKSANLDVYKDENWKKAKQREAIDFCCALKNSERVRRRYRERHGLARGQ